MGINEILQYVPEGLMAGALATQCVKSRVVAYTNKKLDKGYKKVVTRIKNIGTREELPQNHDLLIALRTAMLKATANMGDALVDEMNLQAVEKEEQERVKTFKKKLFEWIDKELDNVEKWARMDWGANEVATRIELLLTESKQEEEESEVKENEIDALRKVLAQRATAEWKIVMKHGVCVEVGEELPQIVHGYIDNGWVQEGKEMDWFNTVACWFADELKNNDKAEDVFRNRLLSEIAGDVGIIKTGIANGNEKLNELITSFNSSIENEQYIKERWNNFSTDLKFVKNVAVEISEDVKELKEGQKKIIEFYEKRVVQLEKEITEYKAKIGGTDNAAILNHINGLLEEKTLYENKLRQKDKLIEQYEKDIEELKKDLKDDNDELKDKVIAALDEGELDDAEALLLASVEKHENREEEVKKKKAEDYYQLGKIKELKLEYRPALKYYELAAQIAPENVDYLDMAGRLSRDLGYVDSALVYLEKAISKVEQDEEKKELLALYYNEIGLVWKLKGGYDIAIKYYNLGIEIAKELYGNSHTNIAVRYNNLGNAWNSKGEYDKAIDYFKKALVIDNDFYGESHPKIAIRYNNLGLSWGAKGEYDKAIMYSNKALKIDREYYGEQHPLIAIKYNNLGSSWRGKKDYNKALSYYNKALAIDKAYYGESHPNIAIRYNNIGNSWKGKGEYDKALSYYNKALTIDKAYYGEFHPNIAISYNDIGSVWELKGVTDKAKKYYKISLKMKRLFFDETHPFIKTTKANLAGCLAKKKDKDKE